MPLDIQKPMMVITAIWVTLVFYAFLMSKRNRKSTVGLPLSFIFATLFCYIGFFSYLIPGYSHDRTGGNLYLMSYDFTEETVLAGTIALTLAMVSFVVGWKLFDIYNKPRSSIPIKSGAPETLQTHKLIFMLFVFLILAILISRLNIRFPMVSAFMGTFENAGIALFCVGALYAMRKGEIKTATLWLLAASALPLYYLLIVGFLSRGFLIFTIITMFWLTRVVTPRISVTVQTITSFLVMYVLLAFFLTWFTFRNIIRDIVWGGGGMSERTDAILEAIKETTIFNPFDYSSLDQLNTRLNQYIFVGKTVELHRIFPELKLYGETLILIPFALVPRAIWPTKPTMYQTPFVQKHTGINFTGNANFGAGQVMEFYANFAYLGIFFGFIIVGATLRYVDYKSAYAVNQNDLLKFTKWFVVGIAFIAPLTQSFFIANSALFAFIIFSLIEWTLTQRR